MPHLTICALLNSASRRRDAPEGSLWWLPSAKQTTGWSLIWLKQPRTEAGQSLRSYSTNLNTPKQPTWSGSSQMWRILPGSGPGGCHASPKSLRLTWDWTQMFIWTFTALWCSPEPRRSQATIHGSGIKAVTCAMSVAKPWPDWRTIVLTLLRRKSGLPAHQIWTPWTISFGAFWSQGPIDTLTLPRPPSSPPSSSSAASLKGRWYRGPVAASGAN